MRLSRNKLYYFMSKKFLKIALFIIIGLALALYLSYGHFDFSKSESPVNSQISKEKKVKVVASLFPWYDLAKEIGGERVEAVLLLPPGLEAHSFEPKPQDILAINQADLFLYTGASMEPWALDLSASLNNSISIIAVSDNLSLLEPEDPHIWLDPVLMQEIVVNLSKTLISLDPEGSDYYQANFLKYQARLEALDRDFKNSLATCKYREIVYAGHYAFAYLSKRYNLDYKAAQSFSPNAETSPGDLLDLSQAIKNQGSQYLFMDKMENPQLAESLARDLGVDILSLKTVANLESDDYEAGRSYEDLMRENLDKLIIGLECQKY